MTTDPRTALSRLIAAFEHHFEVAQSPDSDDAQLSQAEERLRDAFFTYDDELFTQFEVELPFDLLDDAYEDDEDDEDYDDAEDDDILDIEAD